MVVVEEFCREVEAHLCRKNDGHLIRIVGPAFEQVCGWATRGVPLKVAMRGIDRYFERYYAKGPRRRPVRVEFCEPDVLDVFDEWRRAVGVTTAPIDQAGNDATEGPARRHESLPSHLERVIARLTSLRAGEDRSLDPVLDVIVRELDVARAAAKGLRGEARRTLLDRLRVLDRTLIDSAYARLDEAARQSLGAEADAELAPFRDRMAPDAYEQSHRAAVDRLVRERQRLPVITCE
ncbi:MAG TPA: hypothetical protein VI485_00095 [Vicinamibacterales bacterium]|nr:hypothetical protein [Vicinamibacterales bacterium]